MYLLVYESAFFYEFQIIIAKQLGVDETKITLQSKLNEDLGADSLDSTELVMAIEEEFNIEILDEEAEKMQTVGDVLDYLHDFVKNQL